MSRRGARIGRIGEQLAARHLEGAGFEVLARNWRCATGELRGELDIVAAEGSDLVVCEVKTRRRAPAGQPLVAVEPRKAAQLRRLTAAWLSTSDRRWSSVRLDLIAVSWPDSGGSAEVVHVRGVS